MRGPYGKLWTEFFPSFYGQSAKRTGHENKEGKSEDPQLAARTEQKKLIRCLLFGFFDYSGKTRKSFDVLTSDQQLEVHMATHGPEIDKWKVKVDTTQINFKELYFR